MSENRGERLVLDVVMPRMTRRWEQLGRAQRTALELVYVRGLTTVEAAAALGVDPLEIRRAIATAYRTLARSPGRGASSAD